MTTVPTMADTVRSQLHELAAPLRAQLAQIEDRLATIQTEAKDLREARSEITKMLARLDPDTSKPGRPGPKTMRVESRVSGNAERAQRQLEAKLAAVQAIITTEDGWADGFTSNQLAHTLSARVPRGLSAKSARQVLELLRDRGVLRHDRVVKGGGMQFKLVTSMNGAGADE